MNQSTRRQFLQATAAAALAPSLARATGPTSGPARKLNVALVGIGGRGTDHLNEVSALPNASIVAVCDVDSNNLASANKKVPAAKAFVDFRDAIKLPGVDAVLIATPDHTHAVVAAAAMRAGKHVYCEKPLAHTIKETRVLTELAAERKLVTQLGTQIHAMENYRRVVELIRANAIGAVREVHMWNNRTNRAPSNAQVVDPPASLNYDLWLGPAAKRPYHPDFHPFNWRRYWSFGEGLMGDIGCHYLDLPFWALGLKHPTRVSAVAPGVKAADPDTTPDALIVTYEFPGVALTWYDPPHKPDAIAAWNVPASLQPEGVMFVGDAGMLCSNYTEHVLLPADKFASYGRPPKSIPPSPGHQAEWVNACLANDPSGTSCPFSYGGPLTETALLGPVAFRAGKALDWDAAGMRVRDNPDADRLLHYQYRDGWTL